MAGSTLPAVAWDMWRASHSTPAAVQVRQQARLERLLRFARQRSPLYHDLFRSVPASRATLSDYPPVSKLQLAERFDDWVTDRAVTRAGLTAFMADASRVGQRYLERYLVWTSSGTTGEPAMLLQDSDALVVYRALTLTRGLLPWLTPWTLWRRLQRGERVASVIATGGFYAAVVMMEVARRRRPRPFNQVRTISASKPISEIVRELNEFQPAELAGYATMLQLLAEEQLAGRLSISPAMVAWGGEWLSPQGRQLLQTAFRCPIREQYGASEFTRVASGCRRGRLHVSADWAVLEPVDESFRPVPPGRASHTVLLTNLANRVQPLIRYDLGDSITVHPDRCACGSPLPSIEVEGRRDDILYLSTPDGKRVPLLPLAVTTPVYDAPGVRRYQIIQSGPATLSLRLEVAPGADRSQVWSIVNDRMRDYLRRGGLSQVELTLAPEPPQLDPKTRKLRQVIAAWECEQAG